MSSRPLCPTCRSRMREVVHRDVHVDVCDCGGIWFDPGEIERWAAAGKQLRQFPQQHGKRAATASMAACPRCAAPTLLAHVLDGVGFERCERCAGIWLDARGVAQLDPYTGPEHLRDPRPGSSVVFALLDLLTLF